MVPDVEIAELRHGKNKPSPVGTDTRQHGTHIHRIGSKHQFARAEFHGLRIETLLIDIVFQLFVAFHDLRVLPLVQHLALEVGTTVVERLTIRCPGRKHLKLRRIVLQIRHLAFVDVIGNEITRHVVNLNLIRVGRMEVLECLVRRIDDKLQPGMPGWIDAGREDGVVLHVHLLDIAVVGNDGATPLLTGMELHTLRISLLVVVTIDALAFNLESAEDIVVDNALIVGHQTALSDGQGLVADKRRGDDAIAQVAVDAVG